jgi:DNA-binding HxlR family transcriptional regulator
MPRNVRTYDHFCVLARALERVGERWSLLVIRDLLSGPKRFTDLMDRLGGITPKTLTQRLRQLDDVGVVQVDREAGRREVWYRLTPVGTELAPAIEALAWWGWRHSFRPPQSYEPFHPEHMLMALAVVLNRESDQWAPARWHLHFVDDGEYTLANDGQRWSLTSAPPDDPADVTVVATSTAWLQLVRDPTSQRARELGIEITGAAPAVRRFQRLLRVFPDAAKGQARA